MSAVGALRLLGLSIASVCLGDAAAAEEPTSDLAGQFQQICGTTGQAGPGLPGSDVAAADAPGFFAGDLQRAEDSRVVKIGERYAMRARVPSSADPVRAVFLKCAVASAGTSFPAQVDRLSAMLSAKPRLGKTAQDFDFAQFSSGLTNFTVHSEPDGWVSIYKLDMMMRNIPRKYLKKGARAAPAPSVR